MRNASTRKIPCLIYFRLLLVSFLIFVLQITSGIAQSSTSNQFWSKYNFRRAFGNQWSSTINFTGRFTNTTEQKSIFAVRSQFGIQGWAQYHYSSRWRFSGALGYYNKYYQPEINQENSKEFRTTLEALYFFHKIGYTFRTRGRIEFRYINNDENGVTNSIRYRQRIKYIKPINSKSFRKGIFYVHASDEVFFRVNSEETNSNSFFDRNRLTVGGGYVLTDDIQLELSYVNQFLPRKDGNSIVNALYFNVTFSNLLSKIRSKKVVNNSGG